MFVFHFTASTYGIDSRVRNTNKFIWYNPPVQGKSKNRKEILVKL